MVKFTTINHEARQRLGVSFTEYMVADSIYHLNNAPTFKGEINKTYLADFFGINIKNIRLIIKRLIEKDILNKEGNKTTERWWDAMSLKENETSEKEDETPYNIYNIYNNNIIGEKTNKEKKKTDLEELTTEQLIDWRNSLPKEYKFSSFRGREGQAGFENLKTAWLVKRKQYTKDEFNSAMELYLKDIDKRNPSNDYAKHRFSLYEWVKQGNGMAKFASMSDD